MAYGGPWVLGFLAQVADDPSRRRELLAQGEAALAEDSVSHNHFQFRQCALEIALAEGDRAAVDLHTRALERYTADEPLPWSDLQIARARAVLDWVEGTGGPGLIRRLRALEGEARAAGLGGMAESLAGELAQAVGEGAGDAGVG